MRFAALFMACLASALRAYGAEYVSEPNVIPTEEAAKEVLRLSGEKASLRLWSLDVFPHASATAHFDDNVLINDRNKISDFILTGSPGITLVAGDVAKYLPGAVTVEMLRYYITSSPADEQNVPHRFAAVDYTPAFNLYTQHDQYNNVDQFAKFSGAYALTRLSLELDADFSRVQAKNNEVGSLLIYDSYFGALHGRYDLTEATSLDVTFQYQGLEYDQKQYQGYSELRNEDYVNRQVGELLQVGVGAAFGYVIPEVADNQVYQQGLVRAIYKLTGKVLLNASAGIEVREYDSGEPATLHPVFSITGNYLLSERTSFTLEAHRRDQPAIEGTYNYSLLGFSAGVRQLLWSRLSANLTVGYENTDYRTVANVADVSRTDDLIAGRLSFEYEFNRHWKAMAYYSYQQDSSTQPGLDYQNNICGLRLSWTF